VTKYFLRFHQKKGVIQFGKKGKLSLRYAGPFKVKEVVGQVGYRVALPPALAGVQDVFHVSTLWKYVHHPSHVISYKPLQIH
jgi:hypothetical protein